MPKKNTTYPGFEYAAIELSAYTNTIGIFIISLVNGDIVRFTPDDADDFEKWLLRHGVRDIRKPLL